VLGFEQISLITVTFQCVTRGQMGPTAPGKRQGCICQIFIGCGQSFDWRLATIAGMEVAKLVPWNSLLN